MKALPEVQKYKTAGTVTTRPASTQTPMPYNMGKYGKKTGHRCGKKGRDVKTNWKNE